MITPVTNLQRNEWRSLWATVYVLGWLTVTGSSSGASMSACLTSTLPWQARHNILSNAARRSRTITPAINLPQVCRTLTNTRAYQKCYKSVYQIDTAKNVHKHTWNNNNNRFMAFYPGLPGWDSTRKKHSLTHTYPIINYRYQLPPSTMIHSILPVQFTCLSLFAQPLSKSSLVYLVVSHPCLCLGL